MIYRILFTVVVSIFWSTNRTRRRDVFYDVDGMTRFNRMGGGCAFIKSKFKLRQNALLFPR